MQSVSLILVCLLVVCPAHVVLDQDHQATISINVNGSPVNLTASTHDDIPQIAELFCSSYSIEFDRCSHFVAVALQDALWCEPGQREKAREKGVTIIPRLFRFVHQPNYLDSSEFSLLRPRFLANGYVECSSGLDVSGEEDALWVLGHLGGEGDESEEEYDDWPYPLMAPNHESTNDHRSSLPYIPPSSSSYSSFRINNFPRSTHVGEKDTLVMNLHRLALDTGGDRVIDYIPRTWQSSHLKQEEELRDMNTNSLNIERATEQKEKVRVDAEANQEGGDSQSRRERGLVSGIWVQKDPQKELGSGISLVQGNKVNGIVNCEKCILQRYVEDPMLLNGRKFSVGVYTAVTGIDPLQAWLHRELLILVCTRQYNQESKHNASDLLAHLSNGLLNRRLNEGEVPECQGCEYNATDQVWTTSRLLSYFSANGIAWEPIELQMRKIILTSLTSAYDKMMQDVHRTPRGVHKSMFSHWRFDFLFDASGGVWLLEAEIVPSAGTIGGVDEVIKTVVFRDLFSILGWSDVETEYREENREKEEESKTKRSKEGGVIGQRESFISPRPPLDVILCNSQIHQSAAWKLCQDQLLRSPHIKKHKSQKLPLIDTAYSQGIATLYKASHDKKQNRFEELRHAIKAIFKSNGDSLYMDDAAINLAVDWEIQYQRRGAYEPLSPCVSHVLDVKRGSQASGSSKLGPSCFVFMNGAEGYCDDELTNAEKTFLFNKGSFGDISLWRYLMVRQNEKRKEMKASTSSSSVFVATTWKQLAIMSPTETKKQCLACLQQSSYGDMRYCTSVSSPSNDQEETVLFAFRGQCVSEWESCIHRPTGFVDGVLLSSEEDCSLIGQLDTLNFQDQRNSAHVNKLAEHNLAEIETWLVFMKKARANSVVSHEKMLKYLCDLYKQQQYQHHHAQRVIRRDLDVFCDISTVDSDSRDLITEHIENEVGYGGGEVKEITLDTFIASGGMEALFGAGLPTIVRSSNTSRMSSHQWEADSMKQRYADIGVTTLLFDPSRDSAQHMFTAEMSLGNFIDWTQNPSLFQADTGNTDMDTKLIPYVLLTTRHLMEPDSSTNQTTGTSPNAKLMASGGELLTLVEESVDSMFQERGVKGRQDILETNTAQQVDSGGRWLEAWTSLRLGGSYTYPTHIDCFENILLQLSGQKLVRFLPPFAVESVRPDPNHKHWPSASQDELRNAFRLHGWTAELFPGDMLYIPLLWFHSVEVSSDWSATANRYFYISEESANVWEGYSESKKPHAWKEYESSSGVGLC